MPKGLPMWRPVGRKCWFHFHQWERSYFDGLGGEGSGYIVELLAGGLSKVKTPYKCVKCKAFAVVTTMEPSVKYEAMLTESLRGLE